MLQVVHTGLGTRQKTKVTYTIYHELPVANSARQRTYRKVSPNVTGVLQHFHPPFKSEPLEEPCNACIGATVLLRPIRNSPHKLIDRHESLTEDVLDLWCGSVILGWLLGKGNEQGVDPQGNVELPVVKSRSVGHSCGTWKSMAEARTHSLHGRTRLAWSKHETNTLATIYYIVQLKVRKKL